MKYQIYYHYNNGSIYKEEVSAPAAIKALKTAKAFSYLKEVMFQNGSEGVAEAYEIFEDGTEEDFPSAVLYCRYFCNGKLYARYTNSQ